MNICITPKQINNDFSNISDIFMERYKKGKITQLNSDDQKLLDDVADKLNKIATTQNVNFNKEGFKTFIKKLYVYDFTQFGGGDSDDQIVTYDSDSDTKRSVNPPNKFDLFAIIAVVVGIFVIYISYLKFNELSQSVVGMDISSVSEDVKSQLQQALSEIRQLPTEQVTFVQYIWSSIQTFSCSIVQQQSERIKNIVIQLLSESIVDFTAIAEKTCMPRTQVVTEGVLSLGNYDIGRTLNTLVQTASSIASSGATSSCISNTALALQQKALSDLFYNQQLILNQITSQSTQAINFLVYGASIGSSGVFYLIYRTKDVLKVAYTQFNSTPINENNNSVKGLFKITETGGNKKKYTRKNKKHHRKPSRKHKKKTRKHIKKSRKI